MCSSALLRFCRAQRVGRYYVITATLAPRLGWVRHSLYYRQKFEQNVCSSYTTLYSIRFYYGCDIYTPTKESCQ